MKFFFHEKKRRNGQTALWKCICSKHATYEDENIAETFDTMAVGNTKLNTSLSILGSLPALLECGVTDS